jgi:hypothetical protein
MKISKVSHNKWEIENEMASKKYLKTINVSKCWSLKINENELINVLFYDNEIEI